MLLGTTYAWWSETIVVDENIIQMGNLDLTAEFRDPNEINGSWYDLQEYTTTGIFETTKTIEPGYSDVREVRLTNTGSIPLAYRLNTMVDDENELKDYIIFLVLNFEDDDYLWSGTLQNLTTEYVIMQPGEVHTFSVVYFVDPTLGDQDGSFGEKLSLPFEFSIEIEQVGKAIRQ
jgi:hypothetical protein